MSTSQRKIILEHLQKFGTITSLEAFLNYRITRLSSIIYRLRHAGHRIETDMGGREYAIYRLKDERSEDV